MDRKERDNRNRMIVCSVIEGNTISKVAVEHGLSVSRIRQICYKYLRRTRLLEPAHSNVMNARKSRAKFIEAIKKLPPLK
jgi:transposase-like protein